MTPLPALLARLSEATEGSRELDALIWRFVGLTEHDERRCREWCRMDGRTDLTRDRFIDAWARPYTTSLDSALTLVPEGWRTIWAEELSSISQWEWGLTPKDNDSDVEMAEARAPTPALALCIAALKARSTP